MGIYTLTGEARLEALCRTAAGTAAVDILYAWYVCIRQDLFLNYWRLQAYVHRVGRTGRAGQAGTAITLFTDKDESLRQDLEQELGHNSASATEGAHLFANLSLSHILTHEYFSRPWPS